MTVHLRLSLTTAYKDDAKFYKTREYKPEYSCIVDAGGSAHLYTYPSASTSTTTAVGVVREQVLAAGPVVAVALTADKAQLGVGQTANFTVKIDNVGTVALTGVSVDTGGA